MLGGCTIPVGSIYPAFSPKTAHALILECVIGSQILENARRQSVEGLALPFLMNWMLGESFVSSARNPHYFFAIVQYVA